MISGYNGGGFILSSMARVRIEKKLIDKARIVGMAKSYTIEFYGSSGEWGGKQLFLGSSREPYKPRVFKSLDGAVSELSRIGLNQLSAVVKK